MESIFRQRSKTYFFKTKSLYFRDKRLQYRLMHDI